MSGYLEKLARRTALMLERSDRQIGPNGSSVPVSGTLRRGALIRNSAMNAIGDPTGWVCYRPGTYKTLAGVTATGSLSADSVTVNDAADLVVGEFVRFGVLDQTVYEIISVTGTTIGISPNLAAAISDAEVWHPYPYFTVAGIVGGGWFVEDMQVSPPKSTVAEEPLAAGTVTFSGFAMRPGGTLTSQQITEGWQAGDVT